MGSFHKKSAKRMVILLKVESLGILGGRESSIWPGKHEFEVCFISRFMTEISSFLAKQMFFVEIRKGFYFEVSVSFLRKT